MSRPQQLDYKLPKATGRRKWLHAAGIAMSAVGTCGVLFSLPLLYLAYESVVEGDTHADRDFLFACSILATCVVSLISGIIVTFKNAP